MTRGKIKKAISWLRENQPDNRAAITRLRRALEAIDAEERLLQQKRAEQPAAGRNKTYFIGVI